MAGEAEINGTTNYTSSKLHIFFFPFLASGHMIPMIDIAKLFAARGVKSTLLTTPYNEQLFLRSINRTQKLGFDISILTLNLPLQEVGLPDHCQNGDSITSQDMRNKFFMAIRMLDEQFEKLIEEHRPDSVVSDLFLPWTAYTAAKFGIPRLVFHGTCNFSVGASHCVRLHKPHANVLNDSEPFLIPNFPGGITMTRAQLPDFMMEETQFKKLIDEVIAAEIGSYGVIMNSFYELEPAYIEYYRDVMGRRLWQIGPVFMGGQDNGERLQGGSKARVSVDDCLKWLDSKQQGSVVYICFGSMTKFSSSQLREIALGLEASGRQFVWVVKKDETSEEGKEEWLPQGYEERMQGAGLIVRGWAPQVPILNHDAVGAFVTHCGWNSTLEGISAGVPMVTWPVGAEQFYNEKLITQVLRIGVPVGAKRWIRRVGDWVDSEKVEKAVRRIMVGEEAEGMKARASELSDMAKKAVQEGGSSQSGLTALLEELKSAQLAAH